MTDETPRLTFAQREGLAPIPEPLKPKQVSKQLRALLWSAVYKDLQTCRKAGVDWDYVAGHWRDILFDIHVNVGYLMADEFHTKFYTHQQWLAEIFKSNRYDAVFDLVEVILRHPKCPPLVKNEIATAFRQAQAAYRLIDGDTIIQVSSEQDGQTIERALQVTAGKPVFAGARTHLQTANKHVRDEKWADSVRESIHAVDAAVSVLDPAAGRFDRALAKLEAKGHVHGSMKAGFASLYGFASDEKGIRHSLRDTQDAEVDESDALYMLGACSAFVTYLAGKAVAAELLKSD